MGITMHTLDVGLLALALWTGYYLVRAQSAFQDLRHLVNTQGERESHFLGLHRLPPVQGRAATSYADRCTPGHAVIPALPSGLHAAAVPPNSVQLLALTKFDAQMHREALQAVDCG